MKQMVSFAGVRSAPARATHRATGASVLLALALQACAPMTNTPPTQKELASLDQLSQLMTVCPIRPEVPYGLRWQYPDLKIARGSVRAIFFPDNQARFSIVQHSTNVPQLDIAMLDSVKAWTCAQPSPLTKATTMDVPFVFVLDKNQVVSPSFKVTFAGTYIVDSYERYDDPNSITGKSQISKGARPLERTNTVVGRVGTRIGITFRFDGGVAEAPVLYKTVYRFPAPGLTNPLTQKHQDIIERRSYCGIGKECRMSYSFEEPWEVVPGPWVFEIWTGATLLHSETIEVTSQ